MLIYIAHRRRKTSNVLDTLVLSEQECFQWTCERLVTTRRITEVSRQRIPSVLSLHHRMKFPTEVQGRNASTVRNSTQNTWWDGRRQGRGVKGQWREGGTGREREGRGGRKRTVSPLQKSWIRHWRPQYSNSRGGYGCCASHCRFSSCCLLSKICGNTVAANTVELLESIGSGSQIMPINFMADWPKMQVSEPA